ncbi:MAG: diphosphomevalonate decarboxylase, partial [Pseudomonadales bacterium]
TSPFYQPWVTSTASDYPNPLEALAEKDFARLTDLAESSCLKMHGVMQSSDPAMIYWRPATLACIHTVRALRETGTQVFFTIDAGPQVKAVCTADALETVATALNKLPGVLSTHIAGLGDGAKLIDP